MKDVGQMDSSDPKRPEVIMKTNGITQSDKITNLENYNGAMESSELGRYEVYISSPQLREGLGRALIDSGSMVSIVKESSVAKYTRKQKEIIKLQGITVNEITVKGLVSLKIENTMEPLIQECYVVDRLPKDLDVILGQNWLEKAGYDIQKEVPNMMSQYSEKVIKCSNNEKGIRYIEHQIFQPGLIVASSLVNCIANEFPCLVVI
jgi:hypothetical protein